MSELVCVEDFEHYAAKVLPKMAFDYFRSGADEENTLKRNVNAFKNILIRPRCLIDVSNRNSSVSLIQQKFTLPFPIGIAATAAHCLAHPDGEIATAKAAESLGALMIVSTIATTGLEDIASAAPNGLRWFQLYVYKDKKLTESLVKRAELAGYKAIVFTVDTPIWGKRRDDRRNGFNYPPHLKMANFPENVSQMPSKTEKGSSAFQTYAESLFDPSLTWDAIDWLRSITKLPILVKGILTKEDALEAINRKVDGIIVSNHGARQLDSVPATIEALPEVVRAVDGRCEIFVDGGIRTGSDIFKAIALGAKFVFVGRPAIFGLAQGGEKGVRRILEILRDEFDLCMALAGTKNVREIKKEFIAYQSNYSKL